MLTQEHKLRVELITKMMNEKKTTLPSLRNHDRKKVKKEAQIINRYPNGQRH